jgi:outer membrane protein, heavy metal efflux system
MRLAAARAPKAAIILPLALAIAACATYQAKPLDAADVDSVLASPDRTVLVREAAELPHPRLPPVTLDFSKPLDADEIAAIAVLANPDLRSLRLQQHVADAQVFAAGLLPDPQVGFGFEDVLSPLDQRLSSAHTGSLTLDMFGSMGTRRVDQEVARTAAHQVRLDVAWQEWTTAGQARLLALRLPRQRIAATLARGAADAADAALRRTLAAAVRGDLRGDEVEARRIAAADADGRALAAERDAEITRMELNRVLGLAPAEPLDVADPPALGSWPPPDPEALFAAARSERLDLLALAAGYDSQQAALHRAVLGQYPRLAITLTHATDTSRVETFGPAVTLDLPLWNRNRGAIATAGAVRDQLLGEYQARLHQTRAEIAALVAALNQDENARAALGAQLPGIERIAAGLEAAADRGDVAVPLAESARASAIDQRLALLALDQACAEQRLALALAVGRPLSATTGIP